MSSKPHLPKSRTSCALDHHRERLQSLIPQPPRRCMWECLLAANKWASAWPQVSRVTFVPKSGMGRRNSQGRLLLSSLGLQHPSSIAAINPQHQGKVPHWTGFLTEGGDVNFISTPGTDCLGVAVGKGLHPFSLRHLSSLFPIKGAQSTPCLLLQLLAVLTRLGL